MNSSSLPQRFRTALDEDAAFSDVTTKAIPGVRKISIRAKLLAKQSGVVCGVKFLPVIFKSLDRRVQISIIKPDGTAVKRGDVAAVIKGPATAVLAGERTALNLVCRLSGIATLTRRYVDAVKGTSAKILDTRKTTPLWRDLEKYAVQCGGGENHRFSLGDAVLIKDNHLALLAAQKLAPSKIFGAGSKFREKNRRSKFICMEASDYKQVWEAIKLRADIILLDNMPMNRIKGSIVFIKAAREALNSPRPLVEVSGGVTINQANRLARLGVDRISVGAITHSAPALDLSLEVV